MATKKTSSTGTSTAASERSTTKSAAKKPGTTKSAAKRVPAKKSPTGSRKPAPVNEGNGSRRGSSSGTEAPRTSAPKRKSGVAVAAGAAQQLLELTGREAEGVTGLERTDDGWRVEVEVVEVRRIPDTTDVLALYEVTLDDEGELEGYRRLRRYGRGTPGQES